MQWTQSERFWADWSRTAFRFQRAFPQLHLLHFTRPHKMPKVQALPVHWDIGCPSRQRMLQFGPSPAMQEATWATRYQLLKLTSFDLYITVYHIYIYCIYPILPLRIESLDRSVSSTTGWRKNSRSSALATAEKTRQAFHGISSFPESSQDFFEGSKNVKNLLVAPCSFSFPHPF